MNGPYIGHLDHYRGRWQLVIVRTRNGVPVALRLGEPSTREHTLRASQVLSEVTGLPDLGELNKKGFRPLLAEVDTSDPSAPAPGMVPAVRGTLACCGRSVTIRVAYNPPGPRPTSWLCTPCWLVRPLLDVVDIEVEDTPPTYMPVTRVAYMAELRAAVVEALAGMESGTEVSALEISKAVTGARWDTWEIECMFEKGEVTGVRPIGTAPPADALGFWPTTVWAVERVR